MAERDHQSAFQAEYEYHRREWAAQRIGWVVMTLLLVAALAGLFSSGPLSDVTAQVGSHQVEYERFARYGARTKLIVTTHSEVLVGDLPVRISHPFIDAHRIEAITPEPRSMSDAGDAVEFVFDASSTTRIVFRLEPDVVGRHTGELRIGADAARLSQFIYP